MKFKHQWFSSIDEISSTIWDDLNKDSSILKKFAFTKAIEKSNLEGVDLYYLVIRNENQVKAIIPCFSYTVKLEILAGDEIKKFAEFIRKFKSKFLYQNLFVIGSPVATCENHIALSKDIKSDQQTMIELGTYAFKAIENKANETKTALIITKEIPQSELEEFKLLFQNRFRLFESLPNSFIPIITEKYPYPAILRKRYRQRYKKALREVEGQQLNWELHHDYVHISEEIHNLYMNVYHKSKYKFEQLTPEFFKCIHQYLNGSSKVLTCRDHDDKLICAELIIEDEKSIIPLYIGLDYSITENSKIYYNVIFKTLAEAERKNKEWIVLGQTSYEPKAYSGAHFEKLHLGIYSNKSIPKFLIKNVFRFLFPKFKKPEVNSINSIIKESDEFKKRLSAKEFL